MQGKWTWYKSCIGYKNRKKNISGVVPNRGSGSSGDKQYGSKFSGGGFINFKKRWGIAWRQKTWQSTKSPAESRSFIEQ